MRATSAEAAAPNNSTIGGAGTGAGDPLDDPVDPPLDPVLPVEVAPPVEVEDDVLVLKPWLLEPYWFWSWFCD